MLPHVSEGVMNFATQKPYSAATGKRVKTGVANSKSVITHEVASTKISHNEILIKKQDGYKSGTNFGQGHLFSTQGASKANYKSSVSMHATSQGRDRLTRAAAKTQAGTKKFLPLR